VEYPVKDVINGNTVFLPNLGYTKDGDYVGCWFSSAAGMIVAEATYTLKCRLISSPSSKTPARVEIINFAAVTGTGVTADLRMINILNPALPTPSIELAVNIQSRDPSTGAITYLYFDSYRLFTDIISVTLEAPVAIPYTDSSGTIEFSGTSMEILLIV
jgi:hypothetical protein